MSSAPVKLLLYLEENGETQRSTLGSSFKSRATFDWALRQLAEDRLVIRKVKDEIPIHTSYELSERGQKVAKAIRMLSEVLDENS